MVGSVMLLRPDPLPQDAAQLTRIILSLDEENADLKARIVFLERQLFGTKSEKMTIIDPAQATLDLAIQAIFPLQPMTMPHRPMKTKHRHGDRLPAISAVCPSIFRAMKRSLSRRARFALAVRSNCIASARTSARRSTSYLLLSGSNGRSGRAMHAGPVRVPSCKHLHRRA